MKPEEKERIASELCQRLGLDPLLRPIQFLRAPGGTEVPYLTRAATDTLAARHGLSRVITDGPKTVPVGEVTLVVATARVSGGGREETATGAVPLPPRATHDDVANAVMRAETKAKRRATLAWLGLGLTDESELDTMGLAEPSPPREAQSAPKPNTKTTDAASIDTVPTKDLVLRAREHDDSQAERALIDRFIMQLRAEKDIDSVRALLAKTKSLADTFREGSSFREIMSLLHDAAYVSSLDDLRELLSRVWSERNLARVDAVTRLLPIDQDAAANLFVNRLEELRGGRT